MPGPQEDPLVGKTVAAVRAMTNQEIIEEGWNPTFDSGVVLELDDGGALYAMRDPEGNGPGTLVHRDEANETFLVLPIHLDEESRTT